ncbi:MAG: flagellar basal body-associated FliL family protein [Alphaproteobacteria bacterium]|nr:flagellar basal body-associated FliL family protein [Alphaproteobacteria bacterium]
MKLLIIIVVVLILLAGGGGGYYYFFVLPTQDEIAEPVAPPPPDTRLIELDPLRIPVIRSGAVVNYVILNVTLETIGPENEAFIKKLMPRLRNAFLTDLNGYFAAVPVDDRILVRSLKRRMMIISGHVVGQGVVSDVLIQNAFKQKN